MSHVSKFADVILPLAIGQSYTYSVPAELVNIIEIGMRVVVPLGQRKLYTGIVCNLHDDKPEWENIKDIQTCIDDSPIVRSSQLKLWNWIADYYLCSLGEIYKASLPNGLKLESESRFIANNNIEDINSLGEKESLIYGFLKSVESASINDLSGKSGIKNCQSAIKSMLEDNSIFLEEKIKDDYKPKKEIFIRLIEDGLNIISRENWQSEFQRSPKQRMLIELIYSETIENENELKQNLLQENFSLAIINALCKKNLIEKYEKTSFRKQVYNGNIREIYPLSKNQKEAFDQIKSGFEELNVQLIHGVTSSGKTEIYIHLIKEMILKGKQVLYLLPEIALTTQIVSRLQEVFGEEIAVYHSKFNDPERVDVYKSLLSGEKSEKKIILGVRSAIFLPFRDLGLIIVDEEHENTFKQFDPAPRYHARDTAIVLASYHKANVLLGTATPSVESYMNAKSGKYGLVELTERYGGVNLPEIRVVDLRKARLKKQMQSVFSTSLISTMKENLEKGKQIILFQNRRGYSSFLECESCGWIPKCKSCDVSLTYHKFGNILKCHYCGFTMKIPTSCKECNSSRIVTRGFGTELIEDELELILPEARVARLDQDSTRSRKAYQKILDAFARGETDILVGTQMLSKGLDFENVSLVGILNADQMLNFPDFRAFERSFQLMSQVSGRAGRKKERGTVIIQTTDPGHPIINYVINNDFQSFYNEQISERIAYNYPPHIRMIKILIKAKESNDANNAAQILSNELREIFGKRVLGPQPPIVSRVKTWYLQQILLKVERKASFKRVKELLQESIDKLRDNGELKKVRINLDVDPL